MAYRMRGGSMSPGREKTREAGAGTEKRGAATAVLALLTGALVWGLIWYPYRVARDAGVDGILASTLTYAVALLLGCGLFRRRLSSWRPARSERVLLLWLAAAAGSCNLGYVLATLNGEVVRVLLLFYLAPLWTVLLSRVLLAERLNRCGAFIVLLSLSGAAVLLWEAGMAIPLPQDAADWLGLGSGFLFALFNVLSRLARIVPVEVKSMASFVGGVAVGGALLGAGFGAPVTVAAGDAWTMAGLFALLGLVLVAGNVVVQHGLSNMAANRAIVIMLVEVGIAAVSAWLLAGESFGWRETVGGAMILTASLFSARMETDAGGK